MGLDGFKYMINVLNGSLTVYLRNDYEISERLFDNK